MTKKRVTGAFIIAIAIITLFILLLTGAFNPPPYTAYNDGVYVGEAKGYRKYLKARVTLENGYITGVEVVEHYEKGEEHFETPIALVPAAIVEAQSCDVDAISGATLTSNGIMDAVRSALEQGKK
jgi:uncharacterized protein with FMN-binding domain